jgi:hypothetical protein
MNFTAPKLSRRAHPFFGLAVLGGSLGCSQTERWDAGTWQEDCFEVADECDWSDNIVRPETPYLYTLTEPEVGPDQREDTGEISDVSATEALSWAQAHAGDFWDLCHLNDYGSALEFSCPLPVQMAHPNLGLETYAAELCGNAEDARIWGRTEGLLIRKGEAFMSHELQITCDSDSNDTGGLQAIDEGQDYCSMRYTSKLTLQ